MSELNTFFVPLGQIQEQFWDKLTDAPLAGGKIYFYSDPARTIPKEVFKLTGTPPDFTYTSVGTSITLSAIGTTDDGAGNNLVIYLYPYDDELYNGSGDIQLYYISVFDSDEQLQFSVSGVPNVAAAGSSPTSASHNENFIKNGQFELQNIDSPLSTTALTTEIAYGGWYYVKGLSVSTDTVSFYRFTSTYAANPTGNPRYACEISCATPVVGDSYKVLEYRFKGANKFSDPTQVYSFFFSGTGVGGAQNVILDFYRNFGTGGSASVSIPINLISTGSNIATLTEDVWNGFSCTFIPGTSSTSVIGPNDDDYCSIRISIQSPATSVFDIRLTDFCMFIGSETISSYPLAPNSYNDLKIYNIDNFIYNIQENYQSIYGVSATLATTGGIQLIPGTSITLSPGTYLINYSCTLAIAVGTSVYLTDTFIHLYNVTAGSAVPNNKINCGHVIAIVSASLSDTTDASHTIVLVVANSTVFQVAASVETAGPVTSFLATNAGITAIKLK